MQKEGTEEIIERLQKQQSNKFKWRFTEANNFSDFVNIARSEGAEVGENSFVADPLFVNPTNNNFHLQADSPAIDNGTYVGITSDFDYNYRPLDGDNNGSAEWDIGAYKYSGGVGGTSASLSPFAKLLNFFKGLLTRETGKAILTGKTITGNDVNEKETQKIRDYFLPILIIVSVLLIIFIFVYSKKFKKSKYKPN